LSRSDNQRLPKRHLATIIKSPGRLFLILIDAPLSSKLSRYTPEALECLSSANADAVASSCFGVPWIVADGDTYFGQDRLEMLERRLVR